MYKYKNKNYLYNIKIWKKIKSAQPSLHVSVTYLPYPVTLSLSFNSLNPYFEFSRFNQLCFYVYSEISLSATPLEQGFYGDLGEVVHLRPFHSSRSRT